jgi:hypothetical protein
MGLFYPAGKPKLVLAELRIGLPLVYTDTEKPRSQDAAPAGMPGTWREPNRDVLFPFSEALKLWTIETIPILEEVASTYGGYIFYKDLSQQLFERTGVHTRTQLGNWIGKPLGAVLAHCMKHDLPALSSLVVRAESGMVGRGFNEFLRMSGKDPIEDALALEWVAAEERLKCYRRYGSVPSDAEAMLTREYAEKLSRNAPQPMKSHASCSSCGMLLPVSGQCDYCA